MVRERGQDAVDADGPQGGIANQNFLRLRLSLSGRIRAADFDRFRVNIGVVVGFGFDGKRLDKLVVQEFGTENMFVGGEEDTALFDAALSRSALPVDGADLHGDFDFFDRLAIH